MSDRFLKYHPNYFDDNGGDRLECKERLQTIKENVDGGDVIDFGCNGGFFTFGLKDKCRYVLGVDHNNGLIQQCLKLRDENDVKNVDFIKKGIEFFDDNNKHYDYLLYLSTHHGVVADYGIVEAGNVIKNMSSFADVMFFDIGKYDEYSHIEFYNNFNPEKQDEQEYVKQYLLDNTEYTQCVLLGKFRGTINNNCYRFLWMLK